MTTLLWLLLWFVVALLLAIGFGLFVRAGRGKDEDIYGARR